MKIIRRIQKRTLVLWAILLPLSLIYSQGVRLHVHGFEHENGDHYHEQAVDSNGHNHLSSVHLADDLSHNDHHEDIVTEVDIQPNGMLKKLSSNIFAIGVFILLFAVLLPNLIRQIALCEYHSKLKFRFSYLTSPPTRAPPQY